ncbi:MAG: Cl-channel voltage-gated family protein [Verrucomicrobiales bacterium]|nr:Cl-channel voltage-gated family protein [Verrucomicrobiales bacterium]
MIRALFSLRDRSQVLLPLLHGILLALPVAGVTGSVVALFLWALDRMIELQWSHPSLLWGLPLAGAVVGLLYHRHGRGSEKGNNLLIEEIHQPGGGVPVRMAPLVLLGTLVTHLFGGSAGREGTAVQMGGSVAGGLAQWFKVGTENRRLMLMCGIAAGFGAVFGTPLTGAVFALEVLVIGRLEYGALFPVLLASVAGDTVCSAWGIHHTIYHLDVPQGAGQHAVLEAGLLFKAALAGVVFGLAGRLFAFLTHSLQHGFARLVPKAVPLRPVAGGLLVIALTLMLDTRDFLGLGVHAPPQGQVSILSSFEDGGANPWSWLWKTVFTSVTIASGFKGGEVTPLFFIGSTLGNTLGTLLQAPVALFAALGFIAVFAGAANTPLACTIMGMELFGAPYAAYFATACFMAYGFSGHAGIYRAQRVGIAKHRTPPEPATPREKPGQLSSKPAAE